MYTEFKGFSISFLCFCFFIFALFIDARSYINAAVRREKKSFAQVRLRNQPRTLNILKLEKHSTQRGCYCKLQYFFYGMGGCSFSFNPDDASMK